MGWRWRAAGIATALSRLPQHGRRLEEETLCFGLCVRSAQAFSHLCDASVPATDLRRPPTKHMLYPAEQTTALRARSFWIAVLAGTPRVPTGECGHVSSRCAVSSPRLPENACLPQLFAQYSPLTLTHTPAATVIESRTTSIGSSCAPRGRPRCCMELSKRSWSTRTEGRVVVQLSQGDIPLVKGKIWPVTKNKYPLICHWQCCGQSCAANRYGWVC